MKNSLFLQFEINPASSFQSWGNSRSAALSASFTRRWWSRVNRGMCRGCWVREADRIRTCSHQDRLNWKSSNSLLFLPLSPRPHIFENGLQGGKVWKYLPLCKFQKTACFEFNDVVVMMLSQVHLQLATSTWSDNNDGQQICVTSTKDYQPEWSSASAQQQADNSGE